MKEIYEVPQMDIILFETADVITTSNETEILNIDVGAWVAD